MLFAMAGLRNTVRNETMNERTVVTHSAKETLEWAEKFAHSLTPGSIIALTGELGAGKTVIAKGIGIGLGVKEGVISPTFNYILEYDGRLPLYHADLYRIQNAATFLAMGLDEYFEREGVFVIEWAERVYDLLPQETIWISLAGDGDSREITIRSGP
jgi:tRNA threonylcarbamoyladenosine biosynthesis protein TsaE